MPLVLFSVALCPAASWAAVTIALIEGAGGPIAADKTDDGRGDSSVARGLDHESTPPIDPASGQATGKAILGPVEMTMDFNPATPAILRAFAMSEPLAV